MLSNFFRVVYNNMKFTSNWKTSNLTTLSHQNPNLRISSSAMKEKKIQYNLYMSSSGCHKWQENEPYVDWKCMERAFKTCQD